MEARTKGVHMSKELIDRIQELLLENASLKEDVATLSATLDLAGASAKNLHFWLVEEPEGRCRKVNDVF